MIQYGGDMGKKDKSSAKNKASWHYFWFWLLTLGFFWLILFAVKFDFSENSSGAWLVLFLLNILLGIVFFLRFIGNLFQSFKNKDKKEPIRYGFAALALIILFFTSFYTASPIAKAYFALSSSEVKGEQTANDPAKLAQPIEEASSEKSKPSINNSNSVNINTVECIGPDGKHFNTTLEECTALNEKWGEEVNYMVDCPIHQSCGGGTKRMAKKECDNSICCEVGGVWELYLSKTACKQAQDKYWKDYYDDLYSKENNEREEELNGRYSNSSNNENIPYSVPQNPVPANTPIPTVKVDNNYANSRCKGDVRRWLETQKSLLRQNARAKNILNSSWYDYEVLRLEGEAKNKLDECDILYPV